MASRPTCGDADSGGREMSKERPRRVRGINMSSLRLIERIANGHWVPKHQRRLSGKNTVQWRRGGG